jgi:phage repressor protein C with HTH and peptisase S24 domain
VSVSDAYICTLETGKKPAPSDTVCTKLETALDVPHGTLLSVAHMERTPDDVRRKMQGLEMVIELERELGEAVLGIFADFEATLLDAAEGERVALDFYRVETLFRKKVQMLVAEKASKLSESEREKLTGALRAFTNNLVERLKDLHAKVTPAGVEPKPGVDLDKMLDDGRLKRLAEAGGSNVGKVHLGVGRPIPLINKVAAGYPTEFTDLDYPAGVADEYVYDPSISDPNAFAITVCGDSMEPIFREGDVVIVSPEAPVASGDYCFVRLAPDNTTTFKQVYFDNEKNVRLQPLNSKYPPQLLKRNDAAAVYRAVRRQEVL